MNASAAIKHAPAEISKESFLDILRRGTAPPKAAKPQQGLGVAGTPSYLRDNYMIGRGTKAKHWDADIEEDLADVDDEAEGDSERDFADDD